MSLLQQIKDASLDARKAKISLAPFLVTLYSEAAMVGKTKRNSESTDEEVISVLKKFKAGAETMIECSSSQDVKDQSQLEIEAIELFLPKMLSKDELTGVINGYVGSTPGVSKASMGLLMSKLKNEYPGLYDGTLASNLVKTALGSL